MATPTFKVNGRDLAPYLALQVEEGFDPLDPSKTDPQFVGVPALQEGQTYVGSAVGNRNWNVPLILTASDRASLKQLMTDIDNDLAQGVQVEYAHDSSVDASSFFTLEKGRLEPTYEYALLTHATARATLHLWTRPYASPGSARTVASLTGTGPQQFSATGILGDTYALANFEVRVGSAVASAGRVVGYGVHQSASFNGIRTPSTGGIDAGQASSTIVGASGAVGSQYLAIPISPTGASGISFTSYLTPPAGHVGRHRIFAIGRSALSVPITMYAADRFGAVLGPTAQASQTDQTKMQLIDLGEITVPNRASGQEAVPTQAVNLYAGGTAGALINASPAFHLDSLIYLPLDISPGLMRTAGGAGYAAAVGNYADNFDRLTSGVYLQSGPNAVPGPGVWSALLPGPGTFAGGFGGALNGAITPMNVAAAVANATAAMMMASGAAVGDVLAKVDVQLLNATGPTQASGALVEIWPKAVGAASGLLPSAYVGARLVLSPSSLQSVALISASAGNTAVVASAALTASVASAVMGGVKHTLAIQTGGPSAGVFLATGALGAAVISGSNPLINIGGNPGLYMRTPSYAASGAVFLDNFQSIGGAGSAIDIQAREWFHFDAYPELRSFQGNASVYSADRAGQFRGVPPRFPPSGSPGASGPMQVVAFQGEIDNVVGNDGIDLNLAVLERFTFLR